MRDFRAEVVRNYEDEIQLLAQNYANELRRALNRRLAKQPDSFETFADAAGDVSRYSATIAALLDTQRLLDRVLKPRVSAL